LYANNLFYDISEKERWTVGIMIQAHCGKLAMKVIHIQLSQMLVGQSQQVYRKQKLRISSSGWKSSGTCEQYTPNDVRIYV